MAHYDGYGAGFNQNQPQANQAPVASGAVPPVHGITNGADISTVLERVNILQQVLAKGQTAG